ncbi:TolB amino-terminal domain-containing protein [Phyllobacterium sp. CL33Tsu]|uniref:hypothetical protein n=1 Tax=Phyllobacterium sp. CL33Tsu TaxID=1798191 RepID=UPI0008E14A7D|nr:hypothetical protein [Phyllobacterium sp. CL33Tsu]SFJ31702.1 TolB amino-terminal domain-containing protein [Phyllobacterium sp. CL33Tsu]
MSVTTNRLPANGEATLPTGPEILAQLDRIRSSIEFDVPDRSRRLLTYVIEETIAGRADRIKGYSIATEVLGRDASFDAQLDPVVRIQASLIRRGLEYYYLVAGRDDPIIISMPKGGYVPIFSQRCGVTPTVEVPLLTGMATELLSKHEPPHKWPVFAAIAFIGLALSASGYLIRSHASFSGKTAVSITGTGPHIPRLLVRPFSDLSGTQRSGNIAKGLTEEVLTQLSKFKEIIVVDGAASSTIVDPYPTVMLEAAVRIEGERLRVSTRLVNRADGSILWTNSYENDIQPHGLFQLQDDIAGSMATALAQPYGIVFQSGDTQLAQSTYQGVQAYTCTLAYCGHPK